MTLRKMAEEIANRECDICGEPRHQVLWHKVRDACLESADAMREMVIAKLQETDAADWPLMEEIQKLGKEE